MTRAALASLLIMGCAAHTPAPTGPPASPAPPAPPAVHFRTDAAAALDEAKAHGQRAVVVVCARWAAPCTWQVWPLFGDLGVRTQLQAGDWQEIHVDATEDDDASRAVETRLAVETLPAILLLAPDGHELARFGEPAPAPGAFVAALRGALDGAEPPATEDDIHAAALQFVRKVSGYRQPSSANAPAFDAAVDEISAAATRLLDGLVKRAPAASR